jgi:hypothetical protein
VAARRAALDAEEAKWLLAAREAEVHVHLGYATFLEYLERVLGYGPRTAMDRIRVAEALAELPETCASLAAGTTTYSAVRELTRVATADTEEKWLDAAAGKTVREVEELVAGHKPGDLPDEPADPDLRMRALRFDVSPQTFALFREAQQWLDTEAGHRLTEDEIVAAMCASVLDRSTSDRDDGRAAHQIAITTCDSCERTWQDGAGRTIEVPPAVAARARCDAQVIGRLDRLPTRAVQDIPPALRRLVLRRDHHRCTVPGCRSSRFLQLHHIEPVSELGQHTADNLTTLCFAHHDAHHDGRLEIRGRAPDRVTYKHADGREYGTSDLAESVRSALRKMGLTGAEAKQAVERATAHVGTDLPIEELLRQSLIAYGQARLAREARSSRARPRSGRVEGPRPCHSPPGCLVPGAC